MKHVGQVLKEHIESHKLKKKEVAEAAGISYNYLSTIFRQPSCDADLLERLCIASGLHPSVMFDVPDSISKNYSDISASTLLGNASIQIGEASILREQLADKERIIQEKERFIQFLMSSAAISVPGQIRDKEGE